MRLVPLYSGSKGNSTYIEHQDTRILIDAGVSTKKITEALRNIDIDIATIDAILVTHEHSDHIKSIAMISNKFDIPIFSTSRTWAEMDLKVKEENRRKLIKNQKFFIKDIEIKAFNIPHDAVDPVAYSFFAEDKKMTVATDIGHITKDVLENLENNEVLLIESNYDESMLRAGKYPFFLKERILGNFGHLSNNTSAKVIEYLAKQGTKNFILGHLSEENNFPELARENVISRLKQTGIYNQELSIEIAGVR